MTGNELLRLGAGRLEKAGVTGPRLDAEVLLAHAWGLDRTGVLVRAVEQVPAEAEEAYLKMIEKRAAGEPVAYLVGEREFMSLSFYVNDMVLIPRPETELLVETALDYLRGLPREKAVVADVGTGSGAIAVSLAYYHPDLRVFALDVSNPALEVAEANARRHGVADRVTCLCGGLLGPLLEREIRGDLLTANLPYIPSGEIPSLPREVRREPVLALDGGHDGLELYRRLLPQAQAFLKPGGLILCEVGPGQAGVLAELMAEGGWQEIGIRRDLLGEERLVTGKRRQP